MKAPAVFISYSHDSVDHADKILAFADRLRQDGIDAILDQYETSPKEGWPRWMDKHIRDADFVLMICTETYYLRVMDEEKPGKGLGVRWEGNLIYEHIYQKGTTNERFIPVLFESGKVEHIPTPVQGATHYRVDSEQDYEKLYRCLTDQHDTPRPKLGTLKKLKPRQRQTDFLAGSKVSLAQLPSTSPELFGRDDELKLLDDAWQDSNTNIVSFVAWGGVGKTALVNAWLTRMSKDNFRGAERVFGWSFYSQGAREGAQVSADPFIAAALKWFGDPDPSEGSTWEKAERLAELIKQRPTLLILDGVEPLQSPLEQGRIKDQGLCCLVKELAAANNGLCVISTRLKVDDLGQHVGSSVNRVELDYLSDDAGAKLLKQLGVKGTDEEITQAAKEVEGHALALTLLGTYVATVLEGDVRKRDKMPRLTADQDKGKHAIHVMEWYENVFAEEPELDILRIMSLFDRPAESGAIEAVKGKQPINGLTTKAGNLSQEEWGYALKHLRAVRLLDRKDENQPGTLDCHPLIREHFGDKLQKHNPKAWKDAHNQLYEYYKSVAKEYPDTIEEMAPLYAAVAHGCQAGRYQETYEEVYKGRIQREDEFFHTFRLGAIGAELAVLSGFFDPPWSKPVGGLRESDRGHILNEAGYALRALGRLAEATQPMQASLDYYVAAEFWEGAAITAGNLSELFLTIGDLPQAVKYAQESVKHADESRNEFQRMSTRTALADALHQSGRISEAEALFREAEQMQKARQPELPLLYSTAGYKYCDLLLSRGKYPEVQRRATQTLEWVTAEEFLLDIALDNLSLGRSYLLQALDEGTSDFTQAAEHINEAVDGLRKAGMQDFLPHGLLARAELYRVIEEYDKAQKDLDEVMTIATRGGMRLHEADCRLEQARLHLVMSNKAEARQSCATAKEMIEQTGYHRRDKELTDLEQQLG